MVYFELDYLGIGIDEADFMSNKKAHFLIDKDLGYYKKHVNKVVGLVD